MKVSVLIDTVHNDWDFQALQDLLVQSDVRLVMQMPLGAIPKDDVLIWNNSASGLFSVRFAYHLARSMANQNVITMDAHNNLRQRGISMDSTCAVWGGVEDSWKHIFFRCHYSHAVWSGIGFWNEVNSFISIAGDNFWFDLLLKAKEKELFNLVCCTLWLLWNNRNTCFHSHKCVYLEVLISSARRIALESTNQHENDVGSQGASLGIVTRTDEGLVLFSAKVMKFYIGSPLTAEIEAILQGLLLAYEWGLREVILETDCLQAVNEIRRQGRSLIQAGCLVDDIRELSSLFNSCNIVFVRRSANRLAHDLAKSSTDVQAKIIWPGGLPPNVSNMDSVA
ncbi:hypothetical protein REPUB_Repub13aG0011300 [Reevesia pubescens]